MPNQFGSKRGNPDRQKVLLLVVLIAVLGAGLVGIFAALLYSGSSTATVSSTEVLSEPEPEKVSVLLPVRSIEAGTALEPSMFRTEMRPKVGLAPGLVKDVGEIRGLYARSLIASEQPLHSDFITNVKPASAIAPLIPEGYRAVTIKVDVTSSVEGWARAGANVDVVWVSSIRGRQAISTIVQNAKILSAERQMEGSGAQQANANATVPSTVTLLVSAQDAQKIQLASTTGQLSLSLRGDEDTKTTTGGPTTIEELWSGQGVPRENIVPPGSKSEGTVIIRGKNGESQEMVLVNGKLVPAK